MDSSPSFITEAIRATAPRYNIQTDKEDCAAISRYAGLASWVASNSRPEAGTRLALYGLPEGASNRLAAS